MKRRTFKQGEIMPVGQLILDLQEITVRHLEDSMWASTIDSTVKVLKGIAQPENKLFQLIHDHRFGISTYEFYSNKDCATFLGEETPINEREQEIIGTLAINFEPDRGETIEISEMIPSDAITINFK